jgi:hypothetical protein
MKRTLPPVQPGRPAITFEKDLIFLQQHQPLIDVDDQSIIIDEERTRLRRLAVEELLKSTKAMVMKCDASIQNQIEPTALRKDKRRIWEMVQAAEIQMVSALGREEHRSHNAIQRHGELCDAEASLLDFAGDYQNVAELGAEQQSRAKNNSEKIIHMRKVEHGAASEHFLTIKPPWMGLAETTREEIRFKGYENETGWRSTADGFLMYMMQHFKREPFGGDMSVLAAAAGDHVVVSSSGTASSQALQLLRPQDPGPDDDRMLVLEEDPAQHPKALRLRRKGSNNTTPITGVFVCSDVERPAASFVRSIVRLRLMLNTLSKGRVMEALENLCEHASDLEAAFNQSFQKSRARVNRANTQLTNDTAAHQQILNAIGTEISIAKEILLTSFVQAQEMLKKYRDEELHKENDDVGFLPALGVGGGYGGQAGTRASSEFRVMPRPNFIYYDLRACCRAGAEREQRVEARNRFHRILLQCSNAGTWQEALHTFGAMLELSVPPTRETIHLVIRACQRSRPAQPALAVAMTRKMHSMGIASTEKTYLLTMAACSAGGNHRMLAAAFRDLLASGHVPTTATYDNVLSLCGNGDVHADEAPQLYESLRIAGVPEQIAFTGASMCLQKGKVTGRLVRSLNLRGSLF